MWNNKGSEDVTRKQQWVQVKDDVAKPVVIKAELDECIISNNELRNEKGSREGRIQKVMKRGWRNMEDAMNTIVRIVGFMTLKEGLCDKERRWE